MIVVDTSLLSVVLRRQRTVSGSTPHADSLRQMVISDVPPHIPGIVVQEILCGVKMETQFAELSRALERFPVLLAKTSDHLLAATVFNTCQRNGTAATLVDCLIAAQTISNGGRLWTLDQDFARIARHSELALFKPEEPAEKP